MPFVSVVGRPRDRDRLPVTVTTIRATDLLQIANTWLYRSYRDGLEMKVGRSLDAGKTWEAVTVGTGIRKSAPTLAADRWDNLWCWWHTVGHLWRGLSADLGQTWQVADQEGLYTFPRMAVAAERQFLVVWARDALHLLSRAEPTDDFEIIQDVPAPEQLATIRVDRRGILHLFYHDGDDHLLHAYTQDLAAGLSLPVTLATGKYPTAALGIDGGLLVYRDGSAVHVATLDETYGEGLADVTAPSPAYAGGYLGVLLDHRGQAWVSGHSAGDERAQWSGGLVEWRDPT